MFGYSLIVEIKGVNKLDLLLKNGLIIDGTGTPGYKSDVLIKDDKIVKIDSEIDIKNDVKVIDASNKVIVPGFIDIHVHVYPEVTKYVCPSAFALNFVSKFALIPFSYRDNLCFSPFQQVFDGRNNCAPV